MRDKQNNVMHNETVTQQEHAWEEFLKINNLNIHLTPGDWSNAFISADATYPKTKAFLAQRVKHTNHKATLIEAG